MSEYSGATTTTATTHQTAPMHERTLGRSIWFTATTSSGEEAA